MNDGACQAARSVYNPCSQLTSSTLICALLLRLPISPHVFPLSLSPPSRPEFQSHRLDGDAEHERYPSSVDISLFMIG